MSKTLIGEKAVLSSIVASAKFLALFTAVADEEAGSFTELDGTPGTGNAPGYARKDTTGAWAAPDNLGKISNASPIAMAQATADWPEAPYWGACVAGVRGVNDAWVIDVLTDGVTSFANVATDGTFTADAHGFAIGDLLVARCPAGTVQPTGLVVGIQKIYQVDSTGFGANTLKVVNRGGGAIAAITAVGSVVLTKVTPASITANHAPTFNAGDLSLAES